MVMDEKKKLEKSGLAREGIDHGAARGRGDPPGCPGVSLLHQRKYTVPRAAGLVGLGETKLRAMVARGDLPVLDLGGRLLVLESDLESFLAGRYGRKAPAPKEEKGLPPLPLSVTESKYLRKRAK